MAEFPYSLRNNDVNVKALEGQTTLQNVTHPDVKMRFFRFLDQYLCIITDLEVICTSQAYHKVQSRWSYVKHFFGGFW